MCVSRVEGRKLLRDCRGKRKRWRVRRNSLKCSGRIFCWSLFRKRICNHFKDGLLPIWCLCRIAWVHELSHGFGGRIVGCICHNVIVFTPSSPPRSQSFPQTSSSRRRRWLTAHVDYRKLAVLVNRLVSGLISLSNGKSLWALARIDKGYSSTSIVAYSGRGASYSEYRSSRNANNVLIFRLSFSYQGVSWIRRTLRELSHELVLPLDCSYTP